MNRNLGLGLIALLACGCGDDSATGGAEGTTSAASGGSPTDPGISKADCPGTPEALTLGQPAPFWYGLQTLAFTVPGGTPTSIRTQSLDPALGTWTYSYGGNVNETEDGGYLVLASIAPREETKDSSFKYRIRAELDGCPPTEWVGTEAFQVGDPVTGTSWAAHVDPFDYYATVNPYVTNGAGTTTGPYAFADTGIGETLDFHSDGTIDETFEFGIESGHAGDLYDGCQFQVHYTGHWHIQFDPYVRLFITERKPTASPLSGSTCTNPPLAEMQINQPGYVSALGLTQLSLNSIDYTALLYSPPGKVIWTDTGPLGDMASIFDGLSDSVGLDTVDMQAYVSLIGGRYEKQ